MSHQTSLGLRIHSWYRHIIDHQISMNINVLVCLIEELVAKLLMQEMNDRKRNLHGLLIPKTWVLRNHPKLRPEGAEIPPKHLLLTILGTLLQQLHTGIDYGG